MNTTTYSTRAILRYGGYLSLMLLILVSAFFMARGADAQDTDVLREKISERQERINELEREIQQHEKNLQDVSHKADSLENTVQRLRSSQQKLEAEIDLAQQQIQARNEAINQLQGDIETIEKNLEIHREAIADTIRKINAADNTSLFETLLQYDSIAGFWEQIETLERFQEQIQTRIQHLTRLRDEIAEKRKAEEQARIEHAQLKEELSVRDQLLEQNKQESEQLLTVTKQEESSYQQLIAEKKRQREQFEQELQTLESQLQIAIDKSKFPSPGSKVLRMPLNNVSLQSCWNGGSNAANCITQYFGHTDFSRRSNAYKGNGHNGADFRASVGEDVLAAAGGIVQATGNTDAVPGCYSYGKWVLLKHNNGLSTLYAHLSLISVSKGQTVSAGQVIGYAGNTGYSTGPHLHFTVYASEGVRVVQYENSINCKDATIPIADLDAYLDPLNYL